MRLLVDVQKKEKKEKTGDGRGGRPVTWYGGGGMNPQCVSLLPPCYCHSFINQNSGMRNSASIIHGEGHDWSFSNLLNEQACLLYMASVT